MMTENYNAAFYKQLADDSDNVVVIVRKDGTIFYSSPSIKKLLGYEPAELVGRDINDFLRADAVAITQPSITRILADPDLILDSEAHWLHADRQYRLLLGSGRQWQHEGQTHILINVRDITNHHETTNELAKGQELLAKVFAASSNLLSITRPETGEIIDVNDAWCRTFGYTRPEVIGRTTIELNIWGSAANRNKMLADLEQFGDLTGYESNCYSKDGREIKIVLHARSLEIADTRRLLMVCQDVTNARRLEEELRHAQKMEAVGQLTGGIAHDFNNLIGVTMGNAELILTQLPEDSTAATYAREILQASIRAANLTKQLLAFSRRQSLAPEAIELEKNLRQLQPLLQSSVRDHTKVTVACDPDIWQCYADPSQFESALINLTLNARDAMPDGGTLEITACNEYVDETHASMIPGDYVHLAVTDTGVGMDQHVRSHAFEPFFTTKEVGKGTGLGLSMVFGFVQQSGGHVSVNSRVGRGTTVDIWLPRFFASVTSRAARPEATPTPQTTFIADPQIDAQALVIEDNTALRQLVVQYLSELGYNVAEASGDLDLSDALASIDKLRLIVSDILLLGPARGPDLVCLAQQQFPDARVLYITGYSAHEHIDADAQLLMKPFTHQQFLEAIAKLTDSLGSDPGSDLGSDPRSDPP